MEEDGYRPFHKILASYEPVVTSAFKLTFAYHLIIDYVDITTSTNPIVVTLTLLLVTLLDMKLLQFIESMVKLMEKEMKTHPIRRDGKPSLARYSYVAVRLLEYLLKDGADIMVNCFAVLIGAILLRIQPDNDEVALMPRIMLALVVLAYYYYLAYGIHVIN